MFLLILDSPELTLEGKVITRRSDEFESNCWNDYTFCAAFIVDAGSGDHRQLAAANASISGSDNMMLDGSRLESDSKLIRFDFKPLR